MAWVDPAFGWVVFPRPVLHLSGGYGAIFQAQSADVGPMAVNQWVVVNRLR